MHTERGGALKVLMLNGSHYVILMSDFGGGIYEDTDAPELALRKGM